MGKVVHFVLNGKPVAMEVEPELTLLELLRERMGLTGTKQGCGEGDCGACTVIVDGKTINSCLFMASKLEGKEVTTIEGLGTYEKLHPLQEAFIAEGAVQCGYCTPGMILSAKVILDKNPKPTRKEVLDSISGNLCRCTGYAKIANAILRVANSEEV